MTDTNRAYMRGALECAYAPDGYEWGQETPRGADCSGVVSFALYRAGYDYRSTAHILAYNVFTERVFGFGKMIYPSRPTVLAVFDSLNVVPVPPGERKNFKCIHIAPVIAGVGVVDAHPQTDTVSIVSFPGFERRYRRRTWLIECRLALPGTLREFSGIWVDDLDPEWRAYVS